MSFSTLRERTNLSSKELQEEEPNATEYKPPTRLQDWRDFYFDNNSLIIEPNLYLTAYNCIIDIKLEHQKATQNRYLTDWKGNLRKKTRFAKTKESDKVGTYRDLQQKYKPNSIKTLELKLRKLIIFALEINPTKLYSAESWVSLIIGSRSVDEIVEGDKYPELKQGLRDALESFGYPL